MSGSVSLEQRIRRRAETPWTRDQVAEHLRQAILIPHPSGPSGRWAMWMAGPTWAAWRDDPIDAMAAEVLSRCSTIVVNATWVYDSVRPRCLAVLSRARHLNPHLRILAYVPSDVPPAPVTPGSLEERLHGCPERFRVLVDGKWRPPLPKGWLHVDFGQSKARRWWIDAVLDYLGGWDADGLCVDMVTARHHQTDWPDQDYARAYRAGKAALVEDLRAAWPEGQHVGIFGPYTRDAGDEERRYIAALSGQVEEALFSARRSPAWLARAGRDQLEHGHQPAVHLVAAQCRGRESLLHLPDPNEALYGAALARIAGPGTLWGYDSGGQAGDLGHAELWWWPWDSVVLGEPLGPAQREGDAIVRRYRHGLAACHVDGLREPAEGLDEYFPRFRADLYGQAARSRIEAVELHPGEALGSGRPLWSCRDARAWTTAGTVAPYRADILVDPSVQPPGLLDGWTVPEYGFGGTAADQDAADWIFELRGAAQQQLGLGQRRWKRLFRGWAEHGG